MKRYLYELATDQRNGIVDVILKLGLLLLSWGYWLLIQLRKLFYFTGILKINSLSKPVISVGNVTWGGVGKTPIVVLISQMLMDQAKKTAILTRGYMDKGSASQASESDEAQMLRQLLIDVPVLVGKNRFENAKEHLKNNSLDVFLLDDGFSHWALKRDLNIVAIDATNPWGNGQLIPRGILREPVSSLRRADMIVLTKTDFGRKNIALIKQRVKKVNSKCPIVETIHKADKLIDLKTEEVQDLIFIEQKPVVLVSSIGDPQSFEDTIRYLKSKVEKHFIYPDHYSFQREDMQDIAQYCHSRNITTIVTTQKDAVKITKYISEELSDISVFALQIKCESGNGKEVFLERILRATNS